MQETQQAGSTHILAVDDDPTVRDLISAYLTDYEMRVSAVATERDMDAVLAREAVDLVLLDLRLQGEDGMLIARHCDPVQGADHHLTGRQEEADRVMGLELGADDYLTKPFSPRELLAGYERSCGVPRCTKRSLRRWRAFGPTSSRDGS